MTDASLGPALELARRALRSSPAGLLTDMDGTLSPIVSDPAAARLAPGAAEALGALAERLALVAIVTGRAAADARRITGLDGLAIAGNHGTEWLDPHVVAPRRTHEVAAVASRLETALSAIPAQAGVLIEHKGLSATVHYRNAPDRAAALARTLDALRDADRDGIELRHGRMSIELRPIGLGDKGSAVREAVARHDLRGLVVLGDDLTDLDMFRVAAELRAAGGLEAALIAVGSAGEASAKVLDAADAVLPSPAAAVKLLQGLLAAD